MTTRLERYYQKKRRRKKSNYRKLLILFMIIVLIGGLIIVDNSFRNLMDIDDKSVFDYKYDSKVHTLHLFGENHYLAQDKIDTFVADVKNSFNVITSNIKTIVNNVKDKIINN